jgi:hypothetical protein
MGLARHISDRLVEGQASGSGMAPNLTDIHQRCRAPERVKDVQTFMLKALQLCRRRRLFSSEFKRKIVALGWMPDNLVASGVPTH